MQRRQFLSASLTAAWGARRALAANVDTPAARILGASLADTQGWERLEHLCYSIGHRLSGSQALQQSVEWAADLMRADGHQNVELQPAKVNHWVRGQESLVEIEPVERPLNMLGLGMSVATPPAGIEAQVVVVDSFEHLEALGRENVAGKIVLYNAPFHGYGRTVGYRSAGASRAAALGAVASLVSSVASYSLSTPHTGAMRYADDAPKIPAAAVTVEDARRYGYLAARGQKIRLRLEMEAQTLPPADSANPIGEIVGAEEPDKIVVFGGHIDSWDVGHGAHDDGAACVAALQALNIIRALGLRPRRTLRVALWTNEENGLGGARAYREALGDAVSNHYAALEMDGGCERPSGFGMGFPDPDSPRAARALEQARALAAPLSAINAHTITKGGGGADIGPLMRSGVPGFGLRTEGGRYFEWHHTPADTLDKVDPDNFRRAIATLGVFAYALADMPGELGHED